MSSYARYIERRTLLLKLIKETYPDKKGAVVLFAGFEGERYAFRQDSTFYYLTGLEEPACVLLIESEDSSLLYVPQYGSSRSQWLSTIVEDDKEQAAKWGINDIRHLGHPCKGYSASPACTTQEYEHLLSVLTSHVEKGESLFMVDPSHQVTEQTLLIDRLLRDRPDLRKAIVDISPLIGTLRRTKSRHELEMLYEAIDCTMQAQEAVAARIAPGLYEYQVQAAVEFIFKEGGGSAAFHTIVGSGTNSTVLHYTKNTRQLKDRDLVVIDCGAEIGYYCADITRTFPVSGTFTDRQREVYDIVLATQQYIAETAMPGYWLNNKEHPDKSLHHLALEFLEEKGYAQYFPHGIGHFLGMDVHDVGNHREPLKEGDIITIEPGIYISEESLGVRIEDNYWITENGAVCMSEELPRDSYEIEQMMAADLENDEFGEL